MRRRLRDQSGMTLTETVIVVTVFMVVIGATLGVLEGYANRSRTNQHQNDAQDRARQTVDRLTRQLRNLAKPTSANVLSIDEAGDYDLIFQTVDPQKRRVRYCLDDTNSDNAVLWQQTQAFPTSAADPGLPASSACPEPTGASGWATSEALSDHITNTSGPADRNVFYYGGLGADGDTAKITSIRTELFVDFDVGKRPGEVALSSGVFLRNQNQRPSAAFSITRVNARKFFFNGSESGDPEGRTLEYFWYRGSGNTANLPSCLTDATQTGGGFTCIGRGLTVTYDFPANLTGPQTVHLKVVDPGDLTSVVSRQTPAL